MDNTWELISNIPESAIDKFKLDNCSQKMTQPTARSGLHNRKTIKAKHNKNFISNN